MEKESSLISLKGLDVFSDSDFLIKGMDLEVRSGDMLGIAGESGGGKTMLMRTLLDILPDDVSYKAERISVFGEDFLTLNAKKRRECIGRNIGFVPQNTVAFLHPYFRIRDQITDSFTAHKRGSKADGLKRAEELLLKVGLDDPERVLNGYSFELSGGMRQRVNIAMALMNEPKMLIADEPTTALDAQIQRQILDLFKKIHDESGIAVVMISHDLSMLRQYSSKILVMYAGHMVETGNADDVFRSPAHPYTDALLKVIPSISGNSPVRLPEIPGFVPDSGRGTDECIFKSRCREAGPECEGSVTLTDLGRGHCALCRKAAMRGGRNV